MHIYPVDERRISEIERGRSCEAVVPLPSGGSLLIGDTVLFALSSSRSGLDPTYVKGGDSIVVSITGVTDLGAIDPATGRALIQLTWKPLGQEESSASTLGRARKPNRTHDGT
ncbi:hypothetical protein [Singulisphaera sp. PoT]|uniref:hypothetical protein n=1 Tax=Singulisphaera sp. PoT TaxID=3411797 RepID=UPI003BF5824E